MLTADVITDKHDVKCAGLVLARLISGDAKLQAHAFNPSAIIKECKLANEDERMLFATIVKAAALCLREELDERSTAAEFRSLLGDRDSLVDLSALCLLAQSPP